MSTRPPAGSPASPVITLLLPVRIDRKHPVSDLDRFAANGLPSLARNLAEFALYYGDPGRINTRWDQLAKFNAADVQRVAKAYLTPENRTVVISHPKTATGRGGAQ